MGCSICGGKIENAEVAVFREFPDLDVFAVKLRDVRSLRSDWVLSLIISQIYLLP